MPSRYMAYQSVWKTIEPQVQKKGVEKISPQQTGKRESIPRDAGRIAKAPGWRTSKKTGKRYYEGRKNRSDVVGTRL